ncbi:beta-1,3-galactosyltransferase 5-like isoform X2 [Corticium candelabrum]|uniref:beta-1,3-galactosyltransferase 5-like isoform X2 n=1 Tax=Corticium candelabrum TaxID=121492 RepID=UPI002E262146|nr:beta-1,3-galactosyltransferase 5-like isoform X2 [Corticium candelabrum]
MACRWVTSLRAAFSLLVVISAVLLLLTFLNTESNTHTKWRGDRLTKTAWQDSLLPDKLVVNSQASSQGHQIVKSTNSVFYNQTRVTSACGDVALPLLPLPKSFPLACETNDEFYSSPLFCYSKKKHKMLVLILSYVGNFKLRHEIRTGWMRSRFHMTDDFIRDHHWAYTFVVGHSKDNKVAENDRLIGIEKCHYKDILQVDVMEDYYNLTWKKMDALEYFIKSDLDFEVLLKTDDDAFVNIQLAYEWLHDAMSQASKKLNSHGIFYGGYCRTNASPNRSPGSKWYLSEQDYPARTFPPLCFGTAYFISKDLIKAMLKLPSLKKSFRLEDVHSAMLVNKTGLVRNDAVMSTNRIHTYNTGHCGSRNRQYPIAVMAMTSRDRQNIWNGFMKKAPC